MVKPETGRRRGCDRNPPLLFLNHPVHGRGALMNLANLVVNPGIIQDPLGRGGLPSVDVGHDPDITGSF